MLLELNIKNFAIIENLEVRFDNGLNIITGETGTGKSILIEALGVLLGSRSNKDFIRTGEDKAILEAVFYVENKEIDYIIKDYGIEIEEDRILIINKSISKNGPSLTKINGKNVNLSMLNKVTRNLVDIFGQHEHQSLLEVDNHKFLIDSFGNKEFKDLKLEIKSAYIELKNKRNYLGEISIESSERDREIDILKYQIDEIEASNLDVKKDLDIEKEYKKYKEINFINNIFMQVLGNLKSNSFEETAILDIINRDISELEKIKEIDEEILSIYERYRNISFELEDLTRDIYDYGNSLEANPNYLIELENRLDLINRLKSKYGESFEEILKFKDEAQERLLILANQEVEIRKLKKEIGLMEEKLLEKSRNLSGLRKEIGRDLEEKIQKELEYLNMKDIVFKVDFKELNDFNIDGIDRVEFLISTNIGEGLMPLSKIASGGEMSRIMLAFKTILAGHDNIDTMIFDEIDTGISGRTAQLVGEKIYEISKDHQVICISHLPQITAMADRHYSINKETINNKTGSYIKLLDDKSRVEELARLIGGPRLTDTTKKHAREMINMCNELKSKM